MHLEWSALPPSCQEEPSVISVHFLLPPSWQLWPLGCSKFSPSDVPRVVFYCYKSITKSSTVECAPLPNVHISSSVSFYCENKSRCSCPFWVALCKRRHGGIPYRNRHFPLILIAALTLAIPVLCQLCLAPAGDLGHFSEPTQEICSRNGTWISCALTTGPSPSSLSTLKNKQPPPILPNSKYLQQMFPFFDVPNSLQCG